VRPRQWLEGPDELHEVDGPARSNDDEFWQTKSRNDLEPVSFSSHADDADSWTAKIGFSEWAAAAATVAGRIG